MVVTRLARCDGTGQRGGKYSEMIDRSLLSSRRQAVDRLGRGQGKGKRLRVRRTSKRDLRTMIFAMGWRDYAAVEQNPNELRCLGEEFTEA